MVHGRPVVRCSMETRLMVHGRPIVRCSMATRPMVHCRPVVRCSMATRLMVHGRPFVRCSMATRLMVQASCAMFNTAGSIIMLNSAPSAVGYHSDLISSAGTLQHLSRKLQEEPLNARSIINKKNELNIRYMI